MYWNTSSGVLVGVGVGCVGIPGFAQEVMVRVVGELANAAIVVGVAGEVAGRIVAVVRAGAQRIGLLR